MAIKLATYTVSLSLPRHWTWKEADAALKTLEEEDFERVIRRRATDLLASFPTTREIEVTVASELD